MCQLTLIKTSVREVLAPSLIHLLLTNSDFKNRDGAGMYSHSAGVIKTEKEFSDVCWRDFFSKNTDDTVLAHVRAATLSGTGKKEVSVTNSHPYKEGGIILAHNGSIRPKAAYKPLAIPVPEETDSLAFLKEVLVHGKRKKLPFITAMKETMENYIGKFAFLATDARDYYVIRGKSAPLHKCVISFDKKPVFLLVNTEERDLKNSIPLIVHLLSLHNSGETSYELSEIPKETINIVKDYDIEQVETIAENESPVLTGSLAPLYDYENGYGNGWYSSRDNMWHSADKPALKLEMKKNMDKAIKKLLALRVTSDLLDKWSLATIGRPFLTLQENELVTLVYFIEMFQELIKETDGIAKDFLNEKEVVFTLLNQVSKVAEKNTVHWPIELNSVAYLQELQKNGGKSVVNEPILL